MQTWSGCVGKGGVDKGVVCVNSRFAGLRSCFSRKTYDKLRSMKKHVIVAFCAVVLAVSSTAAPEDVVTRADLKALIERINSLEAENRAQAARIAELEGRIASRHSESPVVDTPSISCDEGTKTNGTGRVYTTEQGYKYYLADKMAGIFEPLSDAGLKITPYGWLAFEAVHNTHKTEVDAYTDWVKRRGHGGHNGDHQTVLTMQDSILGFRFETPEAVDGWNFSGKAEFDFAGDHANDYSFHWRHLYFEAAHDSGWSVLFGQTWHLWKMVAPREIDGAWMENSGHPYRRSPQIRLTRKWDWEDSALEARVGIVKNGPGMGGDRDDDSNQDNSASGWALFEAALVYEMDVPWSVADNDNRRWLLGVGGMYGRDKSRRPTDVTDEGDWVYGGKSDEYDSKMLMVAGSVPFGQFALAGQFFGGENLGGVQAGVGQRVGYYDIGRKGEGVSTIGGFADISWKPFESWEFVIGYGFDNPKNADAAKAEGRTFNERAYIDAFYRINANFRVGFEYARLRTKYYGGGDASDDRIQFTAWYDF